MITYNIDKCINCNACIQACPIETSNYYKKQEDGRLELHIDEKSCILCGACLRACKHGARSFTDDTNAFMSDLLSGQNIAVIVAPAIKIAYEGYWQNVLNYLKESGAKHIYDVSFGADICSWAHIRYLQKHPDAKVISQPCAAIVEYCQRHKPELMSSLSPVHSPMSCTAVYIKNTIGPDVKIASLSPCIAKKEEFVDTGLIQYNVTFSALEKYLTAKGVSLKNSAHSNDVDFAFEHMQGVLGSLYSVPGGLRQNLEIYAPSVSVVQSEGHSVYEKLDEYLKTPNQNLPHVFDVLNCEFGCNDGPGVGNNYSHFKSHAVFSNVKKHMLKRNKKLTKFGQNKLFRQFDKKLLLEDFIRVYTDKSVKAKKANSYEMEKAFNALGKFSDTQKNINCRYCGFNSCEHMAAAVATGISFPENCAEYNVYKSAHQHEQVASVLSQSKKIADDLYTITDNFSEKLSDAIEKIHAIKRESDSNYEEMSELHTQNQMLIKEIAEINNSIDKIRSATESYDRITEEVEKIGNRINLVSLNAGIEAASAGEAGKSFAVVAGEVRHLAMTSQEAVSGADKSKNMIFSSVSSVSKIAKTMEESIHTIEAMTDESRDGLSKTAANSDVIATEIVGMEKLLDEIKSLMQNSISVISTGLDE